MKTFSDSYKALQEQFHLERPDYGISGYRYADKILQLSEHLNTRDILDYGAGKMTLAKSLPFPIQNYDPFIPEICGYPHPADIVVNTDCMEHVEEEFVRDVLIDIRNLTKKMVFFEIATRPAQKTLPDGRNAHITIHPASWWLERLISYFEPASFDNFGGFFIFVGGLRSDA